MPHPVLVLSPFRPIRFRLLRICLPLASMLGVDQAVACATCLCGDPTITTMGTEKPFAGRMRVGMEYLTRKETVGKPALSEHEIKEDRVTYSFSYAPNAQWMLGVSVPTITKQVDRYDLSSEQASGVGDSDFTARWFIGKDRAFASRYLWGIHVGLRVPTSTEQKANGETVDLDAQPGAGTTIPSLGAWYGRYQMPWFFYTSAIVQHAIDDGYQGYEAGDAVLLTGLAQYAIHTQLALQFSLDGRWKARDHHDGVVDEDSGGGLVMATPGVAWTPATDLIFNLSYQVPAIESLNGEQDEDSILRAGVTYDF